MRLSSFILENVEEILWSWENFAKSLAPAKAMSVAELRNDAERMLKFIAHDIETTQSLQQQFDKSVGEGAPTVPGEQSSAAHDHGLARAVSHFSLSDLVSEFRALRASVTHLWLARNQPTYETAVQLVRFNEAVDQLIAESVVRFAAKLERDSDLFTASIGHDLRNPLHAMVSWAGVLTRSPALGERERATVRSIERAAQRVAGMVGELQDFTRTRLGSELGYTWREHNVADICRNIVNELAAAHADADVRLVASDTLTAVVDQPRIAQAISNIIGNAIQHGTKGRPVTVRALGDGDGLVIDVHNEGEPISADLVPEIFQPLTTRARSGTERDGHLGLGLYIAHRIVQAHGGTIEVTSTRERGTNFIVRIPRTIR